MGALSHVHWFTVLLAQHSRSQGDVTAALRVFSLVRSAKAATLFLSRIARRTGDSESANRPSQSVRGVRHTYDVCNDLLCPGGRCAQASK